MLEFTLAIQHTREIVQFPDALIFASIKLHLEQQRHAGIAAPAMFVSTDGKAFGTPPILQQLRKLDCTFVNSFDNAVLRVRNSHF